jgi:hypothetical protein
MRDTSDRLGALRRELASEKVRTCRGVDKVAKPWVRTAVGWLPAAHAYMEPAAHAYIEPLSDVSPIHSQAWHPATGQSAPCGGWGDEAPLRCTPW